MSGGGNTEQQPCDLGPICIGCAPRNADGSCPGSGMSTDTLINRIATTTKHP